MVFNKIRKFIVSAMTCLFLASFVSCGTNSGQTALTQINVACFPNITHAQALLMKGQGSLEQAFGGDIKTNWTTFNAGPSEIEALFAGKVDIGYIGPVPAVSGYIQSDGDLFIIAGASNGGSALISRNDANIGSAGDLAGKTVAIPQFGNTQHLSLLALLTANGLAPNTNGGNVKVVPSSNADVANLMDQKNIDAALVPEPWGSILEFNKNGRVVLDYDQVDPNGIPSTAVVIVRKDFSDAYPDAVAKFIKEHKAATAYINGNPASAMQIINAQIAEITQKPIDEYVLEKAFQRLEITWEIPFLSIMDFAKICVEEKMIKKMPDEKIVNRTFIER